jgi:hypothetical protein
MITGQKADWKWDFPSQNSITIPGLLKDFVHYLHPVLLVNPSSQLVTDSRFLGCTKM